MKKRLSIIANILAALIIVDGFNIVNSIAYFLIAGQIPGTGLSIDGGVMLVLSMVGIGFMAGRLSIRVVNALTQPKLTRQQA